MSDEEYSEGEYSQEEDQEPNFIEQLKGDNPKIWGFDYYNVIYTAAGTLSLVMLYLYLVVEEPELKRMVMIQGCLSIGLLFASLYFRRRLQQTQEQRAKDKLIEERKKQMQLSQ